MRKRQTRANDAIYIGNKFGRLTPFCRCEPRADDLLYRIYFDCRCSCGRIARHVRHDALFEGRVWSCGCLRAERARTAWQRGLINISAHSDDAIVSISALADPPLSDGWLNIHDPDKFGCMLHVTSTYDDR